MNLVKKIAAMLFRISMSILLLIFLFKQVDKNALLGIIKNADISLLSLGFIIFFFQYFFCFLRWEMLLKAAKIQLPFKRIMTSFAGGIFFSLFLPSTIGGDLVRSVDLATHTKKPSEVVATVILDRLSGFVGLVLVALLALCLGGRYVHDRSVLIAISSISLVLIAVLLILFNSYLYNKINKLLHAPGKVTFLEKLRDLLKNTHQEIHYFRRQKKILAINLLFSLAIQIISPIIFYIIALALGININMLYFFVFIPIIGAITLLPISIGGLGLRDAMTVFFFAQAGVSRNLAFAMSLLNFLFIVIFAGIGGLIYVLTVHHRRV